MQSNTRVHAIISGRVQGVFYRLETQKAANRIGVNGWVRNRPDGSVEIMAEGEEGLIDDFIKTVKIGPSFGKVTDMSVEFPESPLYFTTFEIRF